MTIHAHPRYLIVTDAAVLVLAEALLVGIRATRVLVSPLAFWMLSIALVLGLAADVAAWYWRGIRSVGLDEDLITVYRGPLLSARSFPRAAISRLKVTRFPGAGRVRFRDTSGRRERITEQVFPREDFSRFLAAIAPWER